jgi:hypothetical protein
MKTGALMMLPFMTTFGCCCCPGIDGGGSDGAGPAVVELRLVN